MNLEYLRSRRAQILEIASRHGVTNVRVFGSVARNEACPGSDVDLLVDVPNDRRGFEYFGTLEDVAADLEQALDCHVDVLSIREIAPRSQGDAERIQRDAMAL